MEGNKNRKNNFFTLVILFLLIFFVAINNIIWLTKDTRPSAWDQSTHLRLSLEYLKIISNPSWDVFKRLLDVSSYYPPFYHFSLIPSHLVSCALGGNGVSNQTSAMTNIIYLALLIIFTYKIGAYFFDERTGLLSAFLISMYQFPVYLSRFCLIDVALAAFVAMSIYYLVKTDNFHNKKYAVIFGILFGIGMLTKWTFFFFLLAPLILTVYRLINRLKRPLIFLIYLVSLIFLIIFELFLILPYKLLILLSAGLIGWRLLAICRENPEVLPNIKNISLSGLFAFAIALPWYLCNLTKLTRHITANIGQIAPAEGDPSILSIKSILYYFWGLSFQVQFIFFLLFLTGLILFFIKWNKKNILLVQWLFISYLIFAFIRNKDLRFTVPFLPAVSIISASWISLVKKRYLRNIIIWLIVVVGIGQFFLFSYKIKNLPQQVTLATPMYDFSLYSSYPPRKENWMHKEVFTIIAKDFRFNENKPFALVRVLSNYPVFHGESFEIYTLSNNLPIYPMGYRNNLGEFTDYLIFKTGDRGPAFSIGHYEEAVRQIENADIGFTSAFTILNEFNLPDGSQGVIYKRDIKSQGKINLKEIELRLKEVLRNFLQVNKELKIEIIPFSQDETSKGRFKKIIISADNAKIKGLYVEKFYAEIENVELNLYQLMHTNKLILFSLQKLTPYIVIQKDELMNLILEKNKNKNIKNVRLSLQNGTITVSGTINLVGINFPFKIIGKISLNTSKNVILTGVKKISLGPFTLPHFLYDSMVKREFSLKPTQDWSLETNINQIIIDKEKFVIN